MAIFSVDRTSQWYEGHREAGGLFEAPRWTPPSFIGAAVSNSRSPLRQRRVCSTAVAYSASLHSELTQVPRSAYVVLQQGDQSSVIVSLHDESRQPVCQRHRLASGDPEETAG